MNKGEMRPLVKALFDIDLTPTQEKIIRYIYKNYYKRIVVSAMTRYGKSMSVAIAVIIYILSNHNKRVIVLSPTYQQSRIIMEYVGRFLTSNTILASIVEMDVLGIERLRKQVTQSRITFKNGCDLRILSAEGTAQRLMGFGADLIVEDESCLIPDEVYRMRITRMLGDNPNAKLVEIGNPFDRMNHMYRNWINPKFESIHVDWKLALKEGRTTQAFIDEQSIELSPMEFDILYNAKFPEDTEDTLIPYEWIRRSIDKEFKPTAINRKIIGVDVAEGGMDFTVVTEVDEMVDGTYIIQDIRYWHIADTMTTAGKIFDMITEVNPDRIVVDATGVGKGVTDRLRELTKITVIGAKVGSSPKLEKWRFLNLKAQYYWGLRSIFEESRVSIPKHISKQHPKLIIELNSMKFEKTSSAKIKIVDPPEKSPDFADSIMLACADVSGVVTVW